jgi:hypothetical protein
MLSGFERLNLLHRIDSINISEVTQGSTTGRPMNQGKLKLEMEVFVLKMNDAAEMWDFTSKENELIVDHTNIANAIVTRNFFGPANNPPTITTSNRSLKTDEEVSFEIAASDPDNDDLLKIELVSTDIPDAKLVQENETDRKAEFQASNLAAGKYELVVRVTDTGLPYKSVEKSIVVNVSEPVAAAPPPPKPAPFKHAQGTYVTGFKGDTLWVNIKTLNEMKFVDVGGSFELDGDVWTVISIESWRKIVISCNGKLLTYRIGDTLDAPRETTIIDVKKTADADLSGG